MAFYLRESDAELRELARASSQTESSSGTEDERQGQGRNRTWMSIFKSTLAAIVQSVAQQLLLPLAAWLYTRTFWSEMQVFQRMKDNFMVRMDGQLATQNSKVGG